MAQSKYNPSQNQLSAHSEALSGFDAPEVGSDRVVARNCDTLMTSNTDGVLR